MKLFLYDLEICNAILGKGETPMEGVNYCKGWSDHENMGISTLCCYSYPSDRYYVFCEDNIAEAEVLFRECDILSGFNILNFDNPIVAHALPGLERDYLNAKSFDIFDEIRKVSGQWCGLNALIKANGLGSGKTGNGAMAPAWYQAGRMGKVIDYCLADVWLTKMLLDKIIRGEKIKNPRTGQMMGIKRPEITIK